ncbi:MAG TPA: hypothetical protein P5277_02190 [Candidatus Paceibacterota bacterium]|nr:hypothetical protein [Candidatus Paceibacterota bacterium]
MTNKCDLCGEKIEETFLGKLNGSIVKIKKENKNEKCYVCDSCQKKHGTSIKKELEKVA